MAGSREMGEIFLISLGNISRHRALSFLLQGICYDLAPGNIPFDDTSGLFHYVVVPIR